MSERRFYVDTFGCQMNVYDSDIISSLLAKHGYVATRHPDEADVVLVNTCSVREKAERRELERVRHFLRLKRSRPGLVVGVVGCMAQRMGRTLIARAPAVDLVVGTDCYQELPDLLQRLAREKGAVVETGRRPGVTYCRGTGADRAPLKALVSVMRGCDRFCTYCVVPLARGRERSKKWDEVLGEVDDLLARGARDITLLGQNVNAYRDGDRGFARLLHELGRREELWRLRFTTSHPCSLDGEIIAAMRSVPAVCEHLHLPLQAGSDRVLAAMGRGYTSSAYLDLLERARRAIPDLWVSTDLMVGFPGETEADFQETLRVVREARFDAAFTFAYSVRPGTRAARIAEQVADEERGARLQRLVDLTNELSDTSSRRLLGRAWEVLVEEQDVRRPGYLRGLTRGNRHVILPGPRDLIGTLVPVKIERVTRWCAEGEPALSAAP